MSSEDTPSHGQDGAGAIALKDAARAWARLLDQWWRQQSAMLPPDLNRAMTSTLDQSKALVEIVCEQAVRSLASPSRAEGAGTAGGFGPWQPVIDACRELEAGLIGTATGGQQDFDPEAMREYRRAARAYFDEFVQINNDISRRVQQRLAADSPADFKTLHAAVVDEAEATYLERVSGDAFAARQAEYINALFRLRRNAASMPAGEPKASS